MKAARCQAIAKSGKPCSASPLPDSPWCLFHAPEAAEARRAAGQKGGRAPSNAARARRQLPEAMDAAELAGWLATLFKGVMAGKVEPKVGTAAAAIAKVMLEVKGAAAIEQLQAQVAALEGEAWRGRVA